MPNAHPTVSGWAYRLVLWRCVEEEGEESVEARVVDELPKSLVLGFVEGGDIGEGV
jgi:hypothetical protein